MNRAAEETAGSVGHPRLALIAAAVLFSTGGAAIKALSFTSWQVASLRSGIAALAVLLIMPAARRGWSLRTWLVGTAYALTMVLFVMSNKLTTSANAIFLQSTAPLYILFLGPLLLHEPVHREDLPFVLAVVAGLAMFFIGNEQPGATAPNPTLGNAAALLSGLCWALSIVALRRLGVRHRGENAAPAVLVAGNLLACVGCLPMALPITTCHAQDVALITFLGVFQIAIANLMVSFGLTHVRALEASAILLVEPALNPIWSWLVHGEVPSAWGIAGGVLILGATLQKSMRSARVVDAAPP